MINIRLFVLWLLLIGNVQASETGEPDQFMSDTYYVTTVDDPAFALPVFDRSGWSKRLFRGIRLEERNIWIQFDIDIFPQPQQPQGLFIAMLATYEAYWDGEYIGSNGQVGSDKNSEYPGQIEHVMLIPKALLKLGTHTVSLKVSAHHHPANKGLGMFYSFVSDYSYLVQMSYKQANLPLVMFGTYHGSIQCWFCLVAWG